MNHFAEMIAISEGLLVFSVGVMSVLTIQVCRGRTPLGRRRPVSSCPCPAGGSDPDSSLTSSDLAAVCPSPPPDSRSLSKSPDLSDPICGLESCSLPAGIRTLAGRQPWTLP